MILNKLIILFGAGKNGQILLKKISEEFKNSLLFCDNDVNKVNAYVKGVPIIAFSEMIKLFNQSKIGKIIVTSGYIDEIVCQCNQAGIPNNILYYYDKIHEILKPVQEVYGEVIYSQDGEEVYLKSRFFNKKQGIYVDVGANHPFRFSNTYWAYVNGWRGINIEPDIVNYKLLQNFRSNDININCGVSDKETQLQYYVFKESALNTFCEEEIRNKNDIVDIRKVPIKRLDSIFREYSITKVDYLDIDVEGMEMNVLNSISWDEVTIECILVEQKRMNLYDIIASKVCAYLRDRGYIPINKYNRTVVYEKVE